MIQEDGCLPSTNAEYNFTCELCDFKCFKQSNFNSHLLTKKHKTHKKEFKNQEMEKKKEIRLNKRNLNTKHVCHCGKRYTFKQGLWVHKQTCEVPPQVINSVVSEPVNNSNINNELINIIMDKNKIIEDLKNTINKETHPVNVIEVNNNVKDVTASNLYGETISSATLTQMYNEFKETTKKIKAIEDLFVKKQRRIDYPGENVVYIVTTDNIKKNNIYIYIVGKTTNLKNRLSVYNKSDEHEVVYYKDCKNEENMNLAESIVLNKLNKYREKANRDRFILPSGEDVNLFCNVVDEVVKFINS